MKYVCMLFLAISFSFLTPSIIAQTQQISVSAPFDQMPEDLSDQVTPHISQPTAEINNGGKGAEEIMKLLMSEVLEDSSISLTAANFDSKTVDDKDFYCIFHILRWSNPDAKGKQTVQAQNWYLYNQGTLTLASATDIPRLFGVGTVTFLFIHLNKDSPGNDYEPLYKFDVQKKTPAYISHFLGVTGLFSGKKGRDALDGAIKAKENLSDTWWGLTTLRLNYKVSDITATAKLTRPTAVEDLGDPQKFDNEGKYLMDFSVGVPVRKISELSFDSVNNTVSPKEIDETNVMAFVNVFPRPRDIRRNNIDPVPHFITGVAIAKQPLHKIFVGAGFGPIVANFYIGAMFVKQEQLNTLQPGDLATPDQLNNDVRRKYKAQVAFGVNMPVGAIIEKLKDN